MIRFDEDLLKAGAQAKRKPHPLVQFPIFLAVFSAAQEVMTVLMIGPMIFWMITLAPQIAEMISTGGRDLVSIIRASGELIENFPDWLMLLMLYLTAFELAIPLLYCLLIEKRSPGSLGMTKKGAVKEYLIGYLIGTALILSVMGLALLFGQGRIEYRGLTLRTVFVIVLYFFGYMIQGAAEEFLCRGYFMLSLRASLDRVRKKKSSAVIAVIVSALVFSLLHVLNPGMTVFGLISIALVGAFLGLYILRTGSIWGACAIHAAWNFVQGNIIGVAVSGTSNSSSVFHMVFETQSSDLWSGGDFGLEGSLADLIVISIALLLLIFLPSFRKKEKAE